MKNIFKYMAGALFAGLTMTACSPETFDGPDQAGVPTTNGVDFDMVVDQSINQVTVSFNQKGAYPIWSFDDGKTYSTSPVLSKIFALRGDYKVSMKVGNRNGISQGEITKTFTMEKTQVDFDSYKSKMCGKQWRIKYDEPGHMGCGPSGTDGLSWWSAGPGAKSNEGVYDDRITFNEDGTYTYDPGQGGTVYINFGCSIYPEYNLEKASEVDFMAPVDPQTSSYSLDADADGNVVIKLAPHTLFPYIANDDQWNGGEFRIESLSNKTMVLIIDNGGIAWHFILTSEEDAAAQKWVDINSDENLGKEFNTVGTMEFWYTDNGDWSPSATPTLSYENGVYTFTTTLNGGNEWMAQNSIHNVTTNIVKGQAYDIHFKISASEEVARYTLKICEETNDNNTFIYKNDLSLDKGTNVVELLGVVSGGEFTTAKFFIDLGGAAEGIEISLSDIIIQESAEAPAPIEPFDYNDANNIWKAIDAAQNFTETIWYGDAGWQTAYDQLDIVSHDGSTHTMTVPVDVPAERWHGQWKFFPNGLTASGDDVFDISVKVNTTQDIPVMTFKVTDNTDDNNFFCDLYDAVDAGDYIFRAEGVKLSKGNDAPSLQVVVDVSGAPVGTVVTVSEITLIKK